MTEWGEFERWGDDSVRLTRLTNGQVMCCICFEYTWRGYLYMAEDLMKVDVCIACAINEGY